MANANPSRSGLREGNADAIELFRDVFTGEVMTAFEKQVSLKDKHQVRTTTHGKSISFPATFKVGSRRHVPGTEITGQTVPHNEVIITIDDQLIADVFVANIDELMNHYDVRAPYSQEIGRELALQYDRGVARMLTLAARGGALFTNDQGGSQLANAAYATNGNTLIDGIADAKLTMDEKDVPVEVQPVYSVLKPAQFSLIGRVDKSINRDFGGGGSTKRMVLETVDGVMVHKSNAVPFGRDETLYNATTNVDGLIDNPSDPNAIPAADLPAKYYGDWTNTIGLVWTPWAAGTAQLLDITMGIDYDPRRLGTLMVGRYVVGHGTLRNKCAVELATA